MGMDEAKKFGSIRLASAALTRLGYGYTGAYSTYTPSTSSNNIPRREVPADLEQIDDLDIEEMDINWQIAMIAIRMKKFYKKTRRRVRINRNKPVGFDKKKLEYFKCHNTGHFARECTSKGTNDGKKRDSFYQDQGAGKKEHKQNCLLTMDDGVVNWGEHTVEEVETNHAFMAISSNNEGTSKHKTSVLDDKFNEYSTCQSNDSEGSFGNPSEHSVEFESESISVPKEVSESKSVTTNEKVVSEPKPKDVEPSCVTHVKTPRQPMKNQETPKVNGKNWNEMMERELGEGYSFIKKKCFVCSSLSHLIRDCDFYEKKMAREAELKKQRVFNTGSPLKNMEDRGTLQNPNANASEEEDEAKELIVVPTVAKHTVEKVGPRKSSTNSKAEEFLTELQNLNAQEKEAYPTSILEDTPEILAFTRGRTKTYTRKVKTGLRRKLDADEVNTGEGINTGFTDVNTAFEEINSGNESIIPSPKKGQREGKAVLEEKSQSKKTKKQIREEQASLAEIVRLQAQEEAENARKAELERPNPYTNYELRLVTTLEVTDTFRVSNIKYKKLQSTIQKKIGIQYEPSWKQIEICPAKSKVFKKQKIADVPDVTKDKSVKREEKFKVQQPILRYNVRKSLARKGLQKNKSESVRSDTEEDVEAYMDERLDEPSSEEFQNGFNPTRISTSKNCLLNDLTRDDLKELYRLMMLKYGDSRPEEEYERVLWGDLKTMFDPPSTEDAVWSLTHQQKVLSWRYFHSCVVHCLTLEAAHIYMLTEVKYPLPSRVCQAMLEKKLIGDRKDEVCYQLLKLIERQAQQQ
ncbi:ribonuclease H-like domain-containing protein [Tanacetum coccineum]